MIFNPHTLGVHKLLRHVPLNRLLDAPHQAKLRRAVNIADLRLIAKGRAHKVMFCTVLSY
jgi:L-lactate dehydrogenase (cytochrome)